MKLDSIIATALVGITRVFAQKVSTSTLTPIPSSCKTYLETTKCFVATTTTTPSICPLCIPNTTPIVCPQIIRVTTTTIPCSTDCCPVTKTSFSTVPCHPCTGCVIPTVTFTEFTGCRSTTLPSMTLL